MVWIKFSDGHECKTINMFWSISLKDLNFSLKESDITFESDI